MARKRTPSTDQTTPAVKSKRSVAKRVTHHVGPRDRLTTKHWKFIAFYLGESCGSAVDAARRAGFGSTYHQWNNAGHNMMQHPLVQKEIRRSMEMSASLSQNVVARLDSFMRANMSDFLKTDKNGIPEYDQFGRPQFDLQKAARLGKLHLIDKLTIESDGRVTVTLPNRLDAAKVLAKYHGLLVDKVEIGVVTDDASVRASILDKLTEIASKLDERDRAILEGRGEGSVIDVTPPTED